MSYKQMLGLLTSLVFFCVSFASNTLYAQFEMSWFTIDSGGGYSNGGLFSAFFAVIFYFGQKLEASR